MNIDTGVVAFQYTNKIKTIEKLASSLCKSGQGIKFLAFKI